MWAAPEKYRCSKDEIGWQEAEINAAKRNGKTITR